MDDFIDTFLQHSPDMAQCCANASRALETVEIAAGYDPEILETVEALLKRK